MKIGDKVRIKSFNRNFMTSDMKEYCGKCATIVNIYIDNMQYTYYLLDIDNQTFTWVADTLETIPTEIEIPEGYTIDKVEDNKIYLKKKELPKTWRECIQSGNIPCQYINNISEIHNAIPRDEEDKNCVPEGLGEPMLSLMQLLVCREVYRQGWKPNWTKDSSKYIITNNKNQVYANESRYVNKILSFQTPEVRDEFLKNFKDLIEKAKELI